ncbi:hypothetical protein TYRP_015496 [Tyrophagus putrescentiae]|nr:hypothetical protein TYRP_015496 [Tyrophagus putrescentiae]
MEFVSRSAKLTKLPPSQLPVELLADSALVELLPLLSFEWFEWLELLAALEFEFELATEEELLTSPLEGELLSARRRGLSIELVEEKAKPLLRQLAKVHLLPLGLVLCVGEKRERKDQLKGEHLGDGPKGPEKVAGLTGRPVRRIVEHVEEKAQLAGEAVLLGAVVGDNGRTKGQHKVQTLEEVVRIGVGHGGVEAGKGRVVVPAEVVLVLVHLVVIRLQKVVAVGHRLRPVLVPLGAERPIGGKGGGRRCVVPAHDSGHGGRRRPSAAAAAVVVHHVADVADDAHRAEDLRSDGRRGAVGALTRLRRHVRQQTAKVGQLGEGVVGKGAPRAAHLRDGGVVAVVGGGAAGVVAAVSTGGCHHQRVVGPGGEEGRVGVLGLLWSGVDVELVADAVHVHKVVVVAKGEGLVGGRHVEGGDLGAVQRPHLLCIGVRIDDVDEGKLPGPGDVAALGGEAGEELDVLRQVELRHRGLLHLAQVVDDQQLVEVRAGDQTSSEVKGRGGGNLVLHLQLVHVVEDDLGREGEKEDIHAEKLGIALDEVDTLQPSARLRLVCGHHSGVLQRLQVTVDQRLLGAGEEDVPGSVVI